MLRRKHNYRTCNCNSIHCMICEGGLSHCIICDGFEGTLTTDCVGYRLQSFILDTIYHGNLDYNFNEWYWKVNISILIPNDNKRGWLDWFYDLPEIRRHQLMKNYYKEYSTKGSIDISCTL